METVGLLIDDVLAELPWLGERLTRAEIAEVFRTREICVSRRSRLWARDERLRQAEVCGRA